jgi:hypothetical protein
MRESRLYGSVRGALSNERPYRVRAICAAPHESPCGTKRHADPTPVNPLIGELRRSSQGRTPLPDGRL